MTLERRRRHSNKDLFKKFNKVTSITGVALIIYRRESMSEIIYTVFGIIATALVGYIFKLKKDSKGKDETIKKIAKALSDNATETAEGNMLSSVVDNRNATQERIKFLRALETAKEDLDGADEESHADKEGSSHEPSSEIAEGLGDLTSDPQDAPLSLSSEDREELDENIKRLSAEQAERIKERLSKNG